MTQGPIETGVVLTTDNTQYDQSMTQSATVTDSLAGSVDQLTAKLKNLSQSAGRKMVGIAAADIATITGATLAYAAFEKQMTSLNAQAAVLNKNYSDGQKQANKYTAEVNNLRKEFGTATASAVGLVTVISKLADGTTPVQNLEKSFTKMGNATGESATQLASSVLQLQKTMGTSQKETYKYQNSLTTLAAGANTSATAIADFAQQIAPVGRLVGQSQADIQGVSTAFIKAGQDGFRAATVYNKVLTDITYATQSGSPELAKYANFVGMTTGAFKDLTGTEKIVSFFEQVNKLGPEAITQLNRMGLDGANTVKAITAVTQQTGGLGSSIAKSNAAMNDSSVNRGNAAAMKGLVDDLAKLRSELALTAESFGERFAPAAQVFVKSMETMASVARKVMDGPIGDLAALFASIAAPIAAVGGGALIAAPMLAKLGTAALFWKGSGAMGIREGMRGAPPVQAGVSREGQMLAGNQIAANGSWFQRYQYNAGNRIGAGLSGLAGLLPPSNTSRDPLVQRLAAGGMNASAYGMRNIGAALFSPLSFAGYNDPTRRSRFFNDPRSPLQQGRDAFAERRAGTGVPRPDMTPYIHDEQGRIMGRAADMGTTSLAMASRSTVTKEATAMSAAFANVTRAAGTMAGALVSAGGNAALIGGKALGGVGRWAAGNSALLGAGALMAGSAMGVESNALTFGATGAMIGGGVGAGLGAVAGLGMDVYQQNKAQNEAMASYKASIGQGNLQQQFMSGQEVIAARDKMYESTSGKSELTKLIPVLGTWMGGSSPAAFANKLKYGAEYLATGENPMEERNADAEKVQRKNQDTAGAYMAIASARGAPIKGFDFSDPNSWQQLDGVLASIKPKMEKLDLTSKDIVDTWTKAGETGDNSEWLKLLSSLADPDRATGLTDRIAKLGAVGKSFTMDTAVTQAVRAPADMNAQYEAINQFYGKLSRQGLSAPQIIRRTGDIRAETADPDSPYYQLGAGVQGQAQRMLAYQMPMMTRTQRFGTQADVFKAQASVMAGDPNRMEEMQAATDSFMQSANEQGEYFKQLLMQQREFTISQARAQEDFGVTRERMDYQYNVSRERAQQDFHIGRVQQEEDYQLSRERAEFDFELMQERGQENFQRSMRRGQNDFQLQRKRQEQDYVHSVEMMVEQQAKSMYSIYDRVKVQSSASANYMLFNAGDQLARMKKQAQDLDSLRGAGVSDDVIQQLGLTDSKNAQQLSRFVAEVAGNPEMVAEFNKMVRKRLRAAAELVKDESSSEWEEFQRQYKLARQRAENDFQRQVNRSHRDFKRQMAEMEEDFRRSMNRQSHDYETSQERQQEAFSRSMSRSAEDYSVAVDQMTDDFGKSMDRAQADLNRMSKEIGGTLTEILTRATNKLGGTASKQAGVVLDALDDLGIKFTKKGIKLMSTASDIFGFDYKPPTGSSNTSPNMHNSGNFGSGPGAAAGGVLQAPRSIGTDNMKFHSKEHGELNLAGGEAIMVPEWVEAVGGPKAVNAMNHRARKGYAGGGNIPAAGDWNRHESGYPWARWAGDINIPGSADYGNPVRAYKPGTVSDVQKWDHSYGNHIRINHPASMEQTLYGHLSQIMVNVLDKVTRGQQIGKVGSTGNSSGPHLHFEIAGGSSPINMGAASGQTTGLDSLLDDTYPGIERAAEKVTLGGQFFPKNWWSGRINKWMKQAMNKRMGANAPFSPSLTGEGGGSNQEIVKATMGQFGWNQWPSLYQLVQHESGFNNNAQNPTSSAYGMFQFLDSTWAGVGGHKTSDPNLQALYGMRYIKNRYKDPNGAWKFWQANNWYGDGGIFNSPHQIGVGERGSEMVLPLNGVGANFLSDLFRKVNTGSEAKMTHVQQSHTPMMNGHTTYQIDRSTTFTGNIQVQAQNPNEFIHQMKAKQRTYALAQQSLGGVRV